ncbi:hypothetical protein [Cryptosporangium minutisporangium]|uniref:Uncharacterized protein n=1 Tax=Cryptosporangium minutisporangium TaxID=113569 RepID=A0ABP6TAD2_9ACTN
MAAPLVFPVGHLLGEIHPGPGAPAGYHAVRVGPEVVRVPDEDSRDVWALAHPDPSALGEVWTSAALVTTAERAGIRDAGSLVERLLAQGLLVEVPEEPAAMVAFARAHRLEPLLVGLGSTPEEPLDGIGVPGLLVAARVPPRVFELWQWAHLWPDLWAACQGLAEVAVELGQQEPGETDPQRVLTFALGATQLLLAHGVAYLDARRTAGPGTVAAADGRRTASSGSVG